MVCHVLPMDVTHILLGWLWLHDFHGGYFDSENVNRFYCEKKGICLFPCQSNMCITARSLNLKFEGDEYEINGLKQVDNMVTSCPLTKLIGTPQIEESPCLKVQNGIVLEKSQPKVEASTVEESQVPNEFPLLRRA